MYCYYSIILFAALATYISVSELPILIDELICRCSFSASLALPTGEFVDILFTY